MKNINIRAAFVLGFISVLISASVFINALTHGGSARITLAAVGFAIFLSMFCAVVFYMLHNRKKLLENRSAE